MLQKRVLEMSEEKKLKASLRVLIAFREDLFLEKKEKSKLRFLSLKFPLFALNLHI
jgi:hypothetical protein